jgi:hypothetical protein
MAPPDAAAGGVPPQAAPPPAPSHAETVATLRHLRAVTTELQSLLKDPALGRSDMKSAIIDGMTKLVAQRMLQPGDAVATLSSVPEKPFDQKKWGQQQLQQAVQAQGAVLAHHAAAFAGQGPMPTPSADTHMRDLSSMLNTHYRSGNA